MLLHFKILLCMFYLWYCHEHVISVGYCIGFVTSLHDIVMDVLYQFMIVSWMCHFSTTCFWGYWKVDSLEVKWPVLKTLKFCQQGLTPTNLRMTLSKTQRRMYDQGLHKLTDLQHDIVMVVLFLFMILYWFCYIFTWYCHGCVTSLHINVMDWFLL